MIVNLFAGPGGWCEGLRMLGRADGVGVEFDAAACATRAAAGHLTIRADVRSYPAERFAGCEGLIASPPCPQFSAAGGRLGALVMGELAEAIAAQLRGDDEAAGVHLAKLEVRILAHLRADAETVLELDAAWDKARAAADEAALTVEPARWIRATRPRWVAMEQVPAVLPLFKVYAEGLRALGYSAIAIEKNAADFGVPQTRRRAFLLAHRDRPVEAPAPTHCRGGGADLFGSLRPWVSMAEALGWGLGHRPAFTTTGVRSDFAGGSHARETVRAVRRLRGAGFIERGGPRRDVPIDEPAPTLTANGGSNATPGFVAVNTGRDWKPGQDRAAAQELPTSDPAPALTAKSGGQWHLVPGLTDAQPNRRAYELDEPAPAIAFGHDAANWQWHERFVRGEPNDPDWPLDRPVTTVAGDPRIAQPGHKVESTTPDAPGRMEGAIRIEAWEAGVLQSFPADYPWQGTKTKQFEQIGNAVPPVLAAVMLAELLR